MKRGGSEAPAAGGAREEEDGVREESEKAKACLFIRETCKQTGANIKEELNNGYLAT